MGFSSPACRFWETRLVIMPYPLCAFGKRWRHIGLSRLRIWPILCPICANSKRRATKIIRNRFQDRRTLRFCGYVPVARFWARLGICRGDCELGRPVAVAFPPRIASLRGRGYYTGADLISGIARDAPQLRPPNKHTCRRPAEI